MSKVGDSRNIPHFVVAGSPKGLQRSMLLNNMKDGYEYRYFDIQFVSGKWYAWFVKQAKLSIPKTGILNPELADGE